MLTLFTKEKRSFTILFIALFSFLLIITAYYVVFLDTHLDEVRYSYTAWLTADGLATPFEDFRTKYGPIGFYSQVFLQKLAGPSMLASRIFSSMFLIGFILLLFDVVRRLGNRWWALVAVGLLVFHPFLIGNYVSTTPYALTAFFAVLSIWFLLRTSLSPSWRIVLASIAISATFLVRYNMLPALLLLWVFAFLWRDTLKENLKDGMLSVGVSSVVIALAFTPYLIIDAEYSLAFVATMLGPLSKLFPSEFFNISNFVANSVDSSSSIWDVFFRGIFSEDRMKFISRVFASFFVYWTLIITSIVFLVWQYKGRYISLFRKNSVLLYTLGATLLLFLAHFVLGGKLHKIYFLYVAPFAIIFITGTLALWHKILCEQGTWKILKDSLKPFFLPLLVVIILFQSFSVGIAGDNIHDIVFFSRFNYEDADINRIKRGGEYLASLTTKEDIILSFDNPYHVLLGGRFLLPPLISSTNEHNDIDNEALLKRYARYNTPMFFEWLEETATVVVFQPGLTEERFANFKWDEQTIAHFYAILSEDYKLIGEMENAYPRKDTRDGIMRIYRRK